MCIRCHIGYWYDHCKLKSILSEHHHVTDEEILSFKAGLRHPTKLDMAQLFMVNVIPDGLESDATLLKKNMHGIEGDDKSVHC